MVTDRSDLKGTMRVEVGGGFFPFLRVISTSFSVFCEAFCVLLACHDAILQYSCRNKAEGPNT